MNDSTETAAYDFVHPEHQLRTQWPVLRQIHERMEALLTREIAERLQTAVKNAEATVAASKFEQFVAELEVSMIIQEISLSPLPGSAWFCLDTSVLVALVDLYFGGVGEVQPLENARALTPTEDRVLNHVTEAMIVSMREAWSSVHPLKPVANGRVEVEKLSQYRQSMVVIDATHGFAMPVSTGSCRIVYPYTVLEPLGDTLVSPIQKKTRPDDRFSHAMRRELMSCDVELRGVLAEARIDVKRLLALKSGDFIPLRDVETVSFRAQQVPLFEARVGKSNGRVSASFSSWHPHSES